jgi:hypothetical protein
MRNFVSYALGLAVTDASALIGTGGSASALPIDAATIAAAAQDATASQDIIAVRNRVHAPAAGVFRLALWFAVRLAVWWSTGIFPQRLILRRHPFQLPAVRLGASVSIPAVAARQSGSLRKAGASSFWDAPLTCCVIPGPAKPEPGIHNPDFLGTIPTGVMDSGLAAERRTGMTQ